MFKAIYGITHLRSAGKSSWDHLSPCLTKVKNAQNVSIFGAFARSPVFDLLIYNMDLPLVPSTTRSSRVPSYYRWFFLILRPLEGSCLLAPSVGHLLVALVVGSILAVLVGPASALPLTACPEMLLQLVLGGVCQRDKDAGTPP